MKLAAHFLVALLTILLVSQMSVADDWPDWMGEKRDGVWREKNIVEKFPEGGPNVLWRKPIGIGYTGPSVSDSHVYVMDWTVDTAKKKKMDEERRAAAKEARAKRRAERERRDAEEKNAEQSGATEKPVEKKVEEKPAAISLPGSPGTERIVCLSVEDGGVVWQHSYESIYRISYDNGPRTTPLVDGNFVYTLGAMGKFICFKKSDGQIVWQKDLTEEYKTKPPIWGYASHPLIHGDMLLCPVGGDGSAIVAFDKKTGKELWKSLTVGDIGYVPLVLFGGNKEVSTGVTDETGSYKINLGDKDSEVTGKVTLDGQPLNNAAINFSSEERPKDKTTQQLIFWHGDGVSSVNPSNGKENWSVKFPEEQAQAQATCIAMPRIVGNRVFFTGFYEGSLMLELDEKDPKEFKEVYRSTKKSMRAGKNLNSLMMTPYVKDGHVYGVANDSRGNGRLMCANWNSGESVWTDESSLGAGGLGFASLFIIPNGDRCFLSNDQGELVIAKLSPEGYEEIDRAKLLEPTHAARGRKVVWSHPAFAGGRMYARNDKEIICVDLRAAK